MPPPEYPTGIQVLTRAWQDAEIHDKLSRQHWATALDPRTPYDSSEYRHARDMADTHAARRAALCEILEMHPSYLGPMP